MARTAVPVFAYSRAGTLVPEAVDGDVTNGHSVANDGTTGVLVGNNGDTDANVTINLFRTVDGQVATPRVVAVAAGEFRALGPFSVADYGSSLAIDVDSASFQLWAARI